MESRGSEWASCEEGGGVQSGRKWRHQPAITLTLYNYEIFLMEYKYRMLCYCLYMYLHVHMHISSCNHFLLMLIPSCC